MQMSHRVVAAQAGELPAGRCRMWRLDGADNLPVTRATGLLGDLPTVRFNLNIVLVAARSKEKRMPETVRCLRRILADEVCRGVAVVAGRNCAVGRLEPAVELFAHDVTVGAGLRVIRQIGPAAGVGECVYADADSDADNHAKQDALNRVTLHLRLSSGRNQWIEPFPKPAMIENRAQLRISCLLSPAHTGSRDGRPKPPKKADPQPLGQWPHRALRRCAAQYRRSRALPK